MEYRLSSLVSAYLGTVYGTSKHHILNNNNKGAIWQYAHMCMDVMTKYYQVLRNGMVSRYIIPVAYGDVHSAAAGSVPTALVVLFLIFLGSFSCMVIMQEIKFNDMTSMRHKMLRILMNKCILYAGMSLTNGFRWEMGLLGIGQVCLFVLIYMSQFLTNRRMENQIQNSCTSTYTYMKHVIFSCVTLASGLAGMTLFLSQWGFNSFSSVCALDSLSLVILSSNGIMVYCIKLCAVMYNLKLKHGTRMYQELFFKRKQTAEMAFYTEMNGFANAAFDVCFYWISLLEYFALYMFRDGIFIHIVDLAILLDVRYLIAHSKRRIASYSKLHQRAQFVIKALPREFFDTAEPTDCSICMDRICVGRRLACGHVFHLKCLLGWVRECDIQSCTCPLCRSDLVTGHFEETYLAQERLEDWLDIEDMLLHDMFVQE
jgi:hypothetical protein